MEFKMINEGSIYIPKSNYVRIYKLPNSVFNVYIDIRKTPLDTGM